MPHDLAAVLGLLLVAAFAAGLFVPRLLRACRVRAAGPAAVSPVRVPAAGGMAVPVQPRGEATRPFAYDNGLVVAPREENS